MSLQQFYKLHFDPHISYEVHTYNEILILVILLRGTKFNIILY